MLTGEKTEADLNVALRYTVHQYLIQQKQIYGDELYIKRLANKKLGSVYNHASLKSFQESICKCQECPLGKSRTKFVFGVGDPNAKLMLVGEAPGEKEDLEGEPFIGPAGKLLDKILGAINRNRNKDVYIANVIKCRPPNNRDPLLSEVEKCEPYLMEQISLINPRLIVALGRVAGKTLLKIDIPLKGMRKKIHNYGGTPLIVTFHPAALLRNPDLKKEAWEDFKWVQNFIHIKH